MEDMRCRGRIKHLNKVIKNPGQKIYKGYKKNIPSALKEPVTNNLKLVELLKIKTEKYEGIKEEKLMHM